MVGIDSLSQGCRVGCFLVRHGKNLGPEKKKDGGLEISILYLKIFTLNRR